MKEAVKLILSFICLAISLFLLFLIALSEFSFNDLQFAIFFGMFATLGAFVFFVLTRNEDNEVTDPGKERRR